MVTPRPWRGLWNGDRMAMYGFGAGKAACENTRKVTALKSTPGCAFDSRPFHWFSQVLDYSQFSKREENKRL
jgi:hypothetical protein